MCFKKHVSLVYPYCQHFMEYRIENYRDNEICLYKWSREIVRCDPKGSLFYSIGNEVKIESIYNETDSRLADFEPEIDRQRILGLCIDVCSDCTGADSGEKER